MNVKSQHVVSGIDFEGDSILYFEDSGVLYFDDIDTAVPDGTCDSPLQLQLHVQATAIAPELALIQWTDLANSNYNVEVKYYGLKLIFSR